MDSQVNPNILLEELCSMATSRTEAALRTLHGVLEKQSQVVPLDFSIATVGRLSSEQGGPSTQTIRNRTGKHFQQLIEAWAAYAGTTTKKPLSIRQKQILNSNDQHVLNSIDDPVIRAVVGSLIAERNKYRDQLNVLKANIDIVIDRSKSVTSRTSFGGTNLTRMEIEALKTAISDEFMDSQCWVVMPTGQVKNEDGTEVYKRGYVNAISKIIV